MSGGLPFNSNLSNNLDRGVKLTFLGFPFGLGANSPLTLVHFKEAQLSLPKEYKMACVILE